MKKILLTGCMLITIPLLNACNSTANQKELLVGAISTSQLKASYPLFDKNHQTFIVNENEQKQIQQWPSNVRIDVYFGTWCHDSQREVPRLLKVLKYNRGINTQLISLDYHKSDPQGKAANNEIKFTPTFIVYRNNSEIGRIVERPEVSLVADVTHFIEKSQ